FDAEHFLQVLKHGYTHEKNHAFFPGYPMILNICWQID
ncbi:MAG: mannosyltransferase family protein, partial [bacterium]